MSLNDCSVGVVIDAGSLDTKAGFASETFPRCITPTVVGRFRLPGLTDGIPDVYCGREAVRKRGLSHLTAPIKNGMVDNWEEMEKFWHHLFYKELHVPPESSKILHAVHPFTPRKHKEQIAEILFESFMIHDLYLAISSALVLHASGRTSGVVWENGYSCCYASPVFEGFPLRHATVGSNLNGLTLTNHLQMLLAKKGYSFTTPADKDILNQIKAKLCYVSKDYDTEFESLAASEKSRVRFNLPDGQYVLVGEERFICPEILFQPNLQAYNSPSVVDDICSSINKCDMDYKSLFFNNIVISGGSSMFQGLSERLAVELSKRVVDTPGINANLDSMSSRNLAVWTGGSVVASLLSMNDFWMTRKEYEDIGVDRVNQNFF